MTEHEKYAQGVTKAGGYAAQGYFNDAKPAAGPAAAGECRAATHTVARHSLGIIVVCWTMQSIQTSLRSAPAALLPPPASRGFRCTGLLPVSPCFPKARRAQSPLTPLTPTHPSLHPSPPSLPASDPEGTQFLSKRAPWKCSVCNVTCTSEETLLGHAAGAKHKRRVGRASRRLPGVKAAACGRRAAVTGMQSVIVLL